MGWDGMRWDRFEKTSAWMAGSIDKEMKRREITGEVQILVELKTGLRRRSTKRV